MQLKCLKCDVVHFDPSAPNCPNGCEGKHSVQAALIHWLIPSTDESISFRAVVSNDPDGNHGESKSTPMVLACRPMLRDPGFANRNVTTYAEAATCQECLQEYESRNPTVAASTESPDTELSMRLQEASPDNPTSCTA